MINHQYLFSSSQSSRSIVRIVMRRDINNSPKQMPWCWLENGSMISLNHPPINIMILTFILILISQLTTQFPTNLWKFENIFFVIDDESSSRSLHHNQQHSIYLGIWNILQNSSIPSSKGRLHNIHLVGWLVGRRHH